MLLDQMFAPALPKILRIVRRNGKMKAIWKSVPEQKQKSEKQKELFPISKERK